MTDQVDKNEMMNGEEEELHELLVSYLKKSEELEEREGRVLRQIELMHSTVTSLKAWNESRKASLSSNNTVRLDLNEIEGETKKIREETMRIQEEIKKKMADNKLLREEMDMRTATFPEMSFSVAPKVEKPKKKAETTKKKEEAPKKKEETLKKKEETPKKKEETPKKKEETPKETEETPKKKEETPKKKEETPKETEEAPKMKEETPKETEEIPKMKEETPKETEGTPKKTEETPNKKEEMLKEKEERPKKKEETSKKEASTLRALQHHLSTDSFDFHVQVFEQKVNQLKEIEKKLKRESELIALESKRKQTELLDRIKVLEKDNNLQKTLISSLRSSAEIK